MNKQFTSSKEVVNSPELQLQEIADQNVWNKFVQYELLQSWGWGEFQKSLGKKIWRVGVFKEKKLACVAQIILEKSKLRSHLYVPNGPVFEGIDAYNRKLRTQSEELGNNRMILRILIEYLKKLAKENNVGFIRLDPLWRDEESNRTILNTLGFVGSKTFVQSENKWILDISIDEEELLRNMGKSMRKGLRRAEKRGVKIFSSMRPGDVKKFLDLQKLSSQNKKYVSLPESYYKKQFEILSKENLYKIFWAEIDGEVVSTLLVAFYNKVANSLHSASKKVSNAELRDAPKLLKWEAILEAKKRGCIYYDFYGISPNVMDKYLNEVQNRKLTESDMLKLEERIKKDSWSGFSYIKMSFGGYGIKMIRPFDIPINSSYWIVYYLDRYRKCWLYPYSILLKFFNRKM